MSHLSRIRKVPGSTTHKDTQLFGYCSVFSVYPGGISKNMLNGHFIPRKISFLLSLILLNLPATSPKI
jgi:hypothetical protein